MSSQFIYLSILVASVGTYFCRAFGMFSAKNIKVDSPIFHWIRCVSMAVIAAVIARIVFFPVGILTESHYVGKNCLYLNFISRLFFIQKKCNISSI